MKKLICVFLAAVFCVFPALGETLAPAEVDLDLTKMSGTMVYSQVYQMMLSPEQYLDKVIRVSGWFDAFEDAETGQVYFCCYIPDASACCAQGLEFVWAGEHAYPEDYPPPGTELTVTGRFETYWEDGWEYIHLTNAQVDWALES